MKYIFTILFSFIAINGFAQINWDELQNRHKEAPKVMVFYFYTDWCSVCKIQDKQLKNDAGINDFLTHQVYYFKLNAEDKNTIQLNGKTFTSSTFITYYLGSPRTEFPLWIILDENYQLIDYYTGLISVKHFRLLIDQLRKMERLNFTNS